MTVYFLQTNNECHVKIGFSSNLKSRIASMAIILSEEIKLLAHMEGDRKTEADLHARFSHLHVRGEWFQFKDDLLEFIAALPKGDELEDAEDGKTNFSQCLSAYQGKYDIPAKELARDIGIAASTLTRLKQGKMPDAAGLVKIMAWMTEKSA